jgi:hypothetical protein
MINIDLIEGKISLQNFVDGVMHGHSSVVYQDGSKWIGEYE